MVVKCVVVLGHVCVVGVKMLLLRRCRGRGVGLGAKRSLQSPLVLVERFIVDLVAKDGVERLVVKLDIEDKIPVISSELAVLVDDL